MKQKRKTLNERWKGGILDRDKEIRVKRNGNNRYTPKASLVPKTEHPLKLMTNSELIKERIRCFKQKRYHQAFTLSYSQKINFIDRLLGICGDNKPMIEKALKEFEKKEGKLKEMRL